MHPVNVYMHVPAGVLLWNIIMNHYSTPTKTYVHEGNTSKYQNEGHTTWFDSVRKNWVHSKFEFTLCTCLSSPFSV